MHVGLPTYSRGVAELGRDEPNRGDDILLPLALALSLPQLGQHRRRAKSSAPRSEILCCVREVRDGLDVVVHVARIDVLPFPIFLVPEQSRPRSLEQLIDESRQILNGHDIPLRDRSLALVLEYHRVAKDGDVRFMHRSDAEGVVFLLVLVAPHAEESLTDQSNDPGAYFLLRQTLAAEIALDPGAQSRKIARHLPDAIVLAQLPLLDGAAMILVLLPPARVEPPHLDRGARIGRDVHVAPRRRNPERIEALQLCRVLYRAPARPLVEKSL